MKRTKTKSKLNIDELHRLEPDYFEPMAISVDDKERRRKLADLLTDAFLYFFSVYDVYGRHNRAMDKSMYEKVLADKVSDAVSNVTGIDGEISKHIRALSKDVVNTTFKNANNDTEIRRSSSMINNSPKSVDHKTFSTALPHIQGSSGTPLTKNKPGDPPFQDDEDTDDTADYWLSLDRAMNIAQSEANTFLNYSDYVDAKDRGYTQKTWLTMLDDRVRDSHEEIEGQTVGIDETFKVGTSEMRFPHDWTLSPDPKEVINCRCAVDYK